MLRRRRVQRLLEDVGQPLVSAGLNLQRERRVLIHRRRGQASEAEELSTRRKDGRGPNESKADYGRLPMGRRRSNVHCDVSPHKHPVGFFAANRKAMHYSNRDVLWIALILSKKVGFSVASHEDERV